MITNGGIDSILKAGKGPKVWLQFTTAAELRTKSQMVDYADKLQDQGCTAISVTVDIYQVSHRERSVHSERRRLTMNRDFSVRRPLR